MGEGPYRASEVGEGVALPRRGLGSWSAAVGAAAALELAVIAWLVHVDRYPSSTFVLGGSLFLVVVVLAGARTVVHGRGVPVHLSCLAIVPALFAEGTALTKLHEPDLTLVTLPPRLAEIALLRLAAWSTVAVMALVVAVASVAAVLDIDESRIRPARASRRTAVGSIVAVVLALGFAAVRARGLHRDALGGALPIGGVIGVAVLAPWLARRVRRLSQWHDRAERNETARSAIVGVASLSIATLAAERAVLANDEAIELALLAPSDVSFAQRFEAVHALAGAEAAHHGALAVLTVALTAAVAGVFRAAGLRALSAHEANGAFLLAALVVASCVAERETRTRARPPAVDPRMATMPLPLVPDAIPKGYGDARIVTEADCWNGSPSPNVALALDPAAPARCATKAVDEHGFLLARGGSLDGLGPYGGLVGSPVVALPFAVGAPSAGVAELLDEGGIGRLRLAETPNVIHGVWLHATSEEQAHRVVIRGDLVHWGMPRAVLVAPSPQADVQRLAELLVAVHEIAPEATVVLTSDWSAMEARFR